MTGLDRGDKHRNRLLGELLAEGDALLHRQRSRELGFLARLLLVDLSSLGLVARGEKWFVHARSHRIRWDIDLLPSRSLVAGRLGSSIPVLSDGSVDRENEKDACEGRADSARRGIGHR
jgi:hypothetical protein